MDQIIKKIAQKTVKKAGKILLKEFDKFSRSSSRFKTHHEIVTYADLMSEKYILEEIKKNFPDHQILSEENGMTDIESDFLWIVDPLDGTTNFSIHNPLWCISVAVVYKKEIFLGLVYAPFMDEMFVAEKGKGARLNDKLISVSKISGDKALHTFCHSYKDTDIKKALKYYNYQKIHGFDCRQLGSAASELAFVACGRTESIMIPGANPWDVAAGALLVQEAGGLVTDFKNKAWHLGSRDILATNKETHKEVLEVINNN